MPDNNTDSSTQNLKLAEMSNEKLVSYIKQAIKEEVSSQKDATLMMSEESSSSTNKPRFVQAQLLLGGIVPNRYLSEYDVNKTTPTGHRGDYVDVVTDTGKIYYNVSLSGDVETTTPFGAGQEFMIYFPDAASESNDYGLAGNSGLRAVPLKMNRMRYAFNEVLSTYTPGTKKGFQKLKSLPFCKEVPSAADIMNKVTPVTTQMRVFSTTKTPQEIQEEFEANIREKLGLKDEDPLPDSEALLKIFKEDPDLLEAARKETSTNTDRPSLTITNDGIAMVHPQGAARMHMSEVGSSFKGRVDLENKPQLPMDPIGVAATELPLDILPQGNVMIPHPKKLPVLDEILTMGVMITRFVTTIQNMGKIIKDLSALKE